MKVSGEKSWKKKTEEISGGVESSTDKTQTEKLILETCDCLDACLPGEGRAGGTWNEFSVEQYQFCIRRTAAQ